MLRNVLVNFIEQSKKLKVLVVGETIIDEFITVSYEGQSMKSICPVYKLEEEKKVQQGGASAVASHLKDFVKSVELITNFNAEIVKTRYIDKADKKKHVEINKFDTKGFKEIKVDTNEYDVVIIADFGHGFLDKIEINNGFHLMCQTNSNNFGFNRLSKWKKYKKAGVCLDLREASLQMNKKIKFTTPDEILELYNYEMQAENLFLTLGGEGAIYCDGKNVLCQPSFESEIVDTIGAGDTFFAFACVASKLNFAKESDRLVVPALAASLSTTWLCNEQSVNQQKLMNHAKKFA